MKITRRYYLLLLLISFLPLIGIFNTPLLLHTHDGFVHLARIAAYYKALKDGEFPVRWAGDLNYGYGMPLFTFMYQVPYFLGAVLLFLGVNLVTAFKIVLALSYPLAGIGMFAFAKEFFQNNKKTFLIAILYQFAPFRLIELLVRGSFGEVYTYAFFPFVLFGIVKCFKKFSYGNFLLTTIASALLILSHNALSLVFFGLCFGFMLVFSPSKKSFFQVSSGLLSGLFLVTFYWFPAVGEHKYTYGDLFMKDLYLEHFPPIQNFFIPNFFNDIHLQTKGISVQFGFFHTIAIVFSLTLLFRKKIDVFTKKILIANLILLLCILFIMQPVSKVVWAHVPLLRQFQFSWRFLAVVSFSTSFLAISFFSFSFGKNKWVYAVLIFLIIGTTAYYWKPPLGYDKINEDYYWKFPLTSTYFGETDVIWSAGPAKSYPKQRVEFISGKGSITYFTRNTHEQFFIVTAKTSALLVDHLEYFPGWKIFVNGRSVPLQFQDPSWRGQITFAVPQGINTIHATFGEDPLRFASDMISICMLIVLIGVGFFKKRFFYETKRM